MGGDPRPEPATGCLEAALRARWRTRLRANRVLTSEAAACWRTRLTDPHDARIDPGSELSADARARGETYLGELLDKLTPLRRDSDPDSARRNAEYDAAIDALTTVGALDVYGTASSYDAAARVRFPWQLEQPDIPGGAQAIAVGVPPTTAEEAAEDARREAGRAARPQATSVVRVIAGQADRRDDLAIVAFVVHEDAVGVHFHYLGPPEGDIDDGRRDLEDFRKLLDGLEPPALSDDHGETYTSVSPRPSSASGAGGMPDPARRAAVTGHWLYTPAAPPWPSASPSSGAATPGSWRTTPRPGHGASRTDGHHLNLDRASRQSRHHSQHRHSRAIDTSALCQSNAIVGAARNPNSAARVRCRRCARSAP